MNAVEMVSRCWTQPRMTPDAEIEELLAKEKIIDRPLEMESTEALPMELYVGAHVPLEKSDGEYDVAQI